MSKEKPILSVRIDQATMDRLDQLVERTGVGRAEIVERCLSVGVEDEEEFVEWLESPTGGPLAALLLHPKVLKAILALTGGRRIVNETQQKVKNNLSAKRKNARLKLATE